MANRQNTSLSSVFDGMLTQSKKQFDELYGGSRGGLGGLGKSAAAMFGGEKVSPSVASPTSSVDAKEELSGRASLARAFRRRLAL